MANKRQNIEQDEYTEGLEKYLYNLKKEAIEDKEKARIKALNALYKTGVIDEEGNLLNPVTLRYSDNYDEETLKKEKNKH